MQTLVCKLKWDKNKTELVLRPTRFFSLRRSETRFESGSRSKRKTQRTPQGCPAIKQVSRAMFALTGNDVYCVNDVTPDGVVGKHHIIATIGSNIIMSGANNITFAQAKTSFFDQVFAYGEDFCSLPPTRERSSFSVANANWIRFSCVGLFFRLIEAKPGSNRVVAPNEKHKGHRKGVLDKAGQPNDVCPYGQVTLPFTQVFAYGEDFCSLPPTRERSSFSVANANWIRFTCVGLFFCVAEKRNPVRIG